MFPRRGMHASKAWKASRRKCQTYDWTQKTKQTAAESRDPPIARRHGGVGEEWLEMTSLQHTNQSPPLTVQTTQTSNKFKISRMFGRCYTTFHQDVTSS